MVEERLAVVRRYDEHRFAVQPQAGERVDLWAHLFGLLVGVALGIPVGFAVARPPGRSLQWILAASAIAAILYCWARALE